MKKLTYTFFNRPTKLVAQELLGKVLVHKSEEGVFTGMVVETEAYIGPHDLASHASRGKTARNEIMFAKAGSWYIYMIYGCHYCLNIVTEKEGYPAAVLIRALQPLQGIDLMKKNRSNQKLESLASGPGKLCQAFGIDKRLNHSSATNKGAFLFVADEGIQIPSKSIIRASRIGVDYAGIWKEKKLRFYVQDNTFVSKKIIAKTPSSLNF